MNKIKCIKCNKESVHAICDSCADEFLDNMSDKDLLAHALVGMDVINGKDKLLEKLKYYKELLNEQV